jgi:D-alanyl-D-alanine dipeptidase
VVRLQAHEERAILRREPREAGMKRYIVEWLHREVFPIQRFTIQRFSPGRNHLEFVWRWR